MATQEELLALKRSHPDFDYDLEKIAQLLQKHTPSNTNSSHNQEKIFYYIHLWVYTKINKYSVTHHKKHADIENILDKFNKKTKELYELYHIDKNNFYNDRIFIENFLSEEYDKIYIKTRNGNADKSTPDELESIAILLHISVMWHPLSTKIQDRSNFFR